MNFDEHRQFLSAWLRNPRQTGALLPSGNDLAQAMAAQVDVRARTVVELGPGTGVITNALMARLAPTARLFLLEKDVRLHAQLRNRFAATSVCCGDAADLRDVLRAHDIHDVCAVVSSLPLLTMGSGVREATLRQIAGALAPGGRLVQYTYVPGPPIKPGLAQELGLRGERVRRVHWNLPPASVWVYFKSVHG